MNPVFLDVEDLVSIVDEIGVGPVRDLGILDSAAQRPQTFLGGQYVYRDECEMAAALLESIGRNHPLVDGNKRLGWVATYTFLALNSLDLDAPEDDAYNLVVGVVTGNIPLSVSAESLRGWTRPRATLRRE